MTKEQVESRGSMHVQQDRVSRVLDELKKANPVWLGSILPEDTKVPLVVKDGLYREALEIGIWYQFTARIEVSLGELESCANDDELRTLLLRRLERRNSEVLGLVQETQEAIDAAGKG